MKNVFILALAAAIILAMSITAFAVPSGKTVEFTPKGADKVVFDGKIHNGKGIKCADCHPALFPMKKAKDAVPVTMKQMEEGKSCGACHNGTKAFSVKDKATCVKCHKK